MPGGTLIDGQVALVIGASGGIGAAVASALLDAGAREVIAASRRPKLSTDPRITPLSMDITSARSVADVAADFGARITSVVNVSGVNSNRQLSAYDETAARHEMEVNYFGLLNIFRAFAPGMKARRSGAFVNVLSVLAHVSHPMMATYCASKAASYSLTQAMRAELAPFCVTVYAVFPPVVDTLMSEHIPQPKLSPRTLASLLVEAMRTGKEDIYPGAAEALRQALQSDSKAVERSFAARLPVA